MAEGTDEKDAKITAAEKKAAEAEKRAAEADAKMKAIEEADAKKAAKSKAEADEAHAKEIVAAKERADRAEADLAKINKRAEEAASKIYEALGKPSQEKLAIVKDKLTPTEWYDLVAAERDTVEAKVGDGDKGDKADKKDTKTPPVGGSGSKNNNAEGYQLSQRAMDVLDAEGVSTKTMAHAQLRFGTDADADDIEEGRAPEGIPRFSLPVRKLREAMQVQSPKILNAEEYNRRMQNR